MDYWTRTGLIRPSIDPGRGSGTKRRYSEADCELVTLFKLLLDAGCALDTIRMLGPTLREAASDGLEWVVVGKQGPVAVSTEGLVAMLAVEAPAFVLSVTDHWRGVAA